MFSFLVVDDNPTVILERSEGSKSEMRVTVLFLPALILRSAKASLKNDSGVGAVQKTILSVALESLWLSVMSAFGTFTVMIVLSHKFTV